MFNRTGKLFNGQGSVEWIIVVALVGVALIAGWQSLSSSEGEKIDDVKEVLADAGGSGGTGGTDGPGSGGEEPEPEPEPEATSENAYAMLYTDGTMIFQIGDEEDSGHGELVAKWNNWLDQQPTTLLDVWWNGEAANIRSVKFKDRMAPRSTACWFQECVNLTSFDAANLDMSRVTDMDNMFRGCRSIETLDLSGLDVSGVTSMRYVFEDCNTLKTLNVSGWDTGSATTMNNLFNDCRLLSGIDVSGWDTSKVTNMAGVFEDCNALERIDISSWDMSAVTDVTWLFHNCASLKEIKTGTGFKVATIHLNWISGIWKNSSGKTITQLTFPSGVADTYTR